MHLKSVTWKNGDIFTEACKLLKIRVQVDNGQATLNLFVMKQAVYELGGMDVSILECRIVVGLCLLFSTLFSHDCDLIEDYSLLIIIGLDLYGYAYLTTYVYSAL